MQPAGWTGRGSRADLNFVRFLSEIPRANSKSNSAEFGAGEAKTWKIDGSKEKGAGCRRRWRRSIGRCFWQAESDRSSGDARPDGLLFL